MDIRTALESFPFIAITRGIKPEEAKPCAQVLVEHGFRLIEVPLNSPESLLSIRLMTEHLDDTVTTGAGTVTEVAQVEQVKAAGGRLIISPHCDPDIIRAARDLEMIPIPGVATPTEAMTAIRAGAKALKLFPAEIITPAAVKAMKAILPPDICLIPVGGINADNWQPYLKAGAHGFGLGSSLYTKDASTEEISTRALRFSKNWDLWKSQGHGK